MKNLIIFDLDGTLLDTGEGIIKSLKFALKKFGFQIPDEEICKSFVGPPLKKRFLELFDSDEQTADMLLACFREEYGKGDLFLAHVYPGVEECLKELRERYALAVATNKSETQAAQLLERFSLASYFDVICGSDMKAALSKVQIVANAASRLGFSPADCVVVGDSGNDAEAAERLGMQFIGVTYGYGFKYAEDLTSYPYTAYAEYPMQINEIAINIF